MASKVRFKREFLIFIAVGISTVIIDYIFYIFLISLNFTDYYAKAISFLIGAIYSYQANRVWTFSYRSHSIKNATKFLTLYLFSLSINIIANSYAISIMPFEYKNRIQLAFIIATMCSATANFIGMKYIVFKMK